MTDSSNLEKNYTRNKIRLELLPLIKSINPNFEEAISRTVKTINYDENFLENESEKALKSVTEKSSWNASLICELEESLKNRVIFKILKSLTNSRVEQKHVNQVEELIKNKKELMQDKKELMQDKKEFTKEKEILENDMQTLEVQKQNLETEKTNLETEKINLENEKINLKNEKIILIKELKEINIPIDKIAKLTNMSKNQILNIN